VASTVECRVPPAANVLGTKEISPNGRSLLYTKFVSPGADLMLVENFK